MLSLYDNHFTGSLTQKISMPSLTKFLVAYNQFVGALPNVWDTSNLVTLDLGHNQFSGPLPDAIGNLKHLQTLYIDYCEGINGTVPKSFGNLLSLIDISLARNNLTNYTIPHSWSRFSNLSYLQLSNLVGELPAWMGQSWLKLYTLWMYDNNFSGGIPASNLESLDILNFGFSGSVPESFS